MDKPSPEPEEPIREKLPLENSWFSDLEGEWGRDPHYIDRQKVSAYREKIIKTERVLMKLHPVSSIEDTEDLDKKLREKVKRYPDFPKDDSDKAIREQWHYALAIFQICWEARKNELVSTIKEWLDPIVIQVSALMFLTRYFFDKPPEENGMPQFFTKLTTDIYADPGITTRTKRPDYDDYEYAYKQRIYSLGGAPLLIKQLKNSFVPIDFFQVIRAYEVLCKWQIGSFISLEHYTPLPGSLRAVFVPPSFLPYEARRLTQEKEDTIEYMQQRILMRRSSRDPNPVLHYTVAAYWLMESIVKEEDPLTLLHRWTWDTCAGIKQDELMYAFYKMTKRLQRWAKTKAKRESDCSERLKVIEKQITPAEESPVGFVERWGHRVISGQIKVFDWIAGQNLMTGKKITRWRKTNRGEKKNG